MALQVTWAPDTLTYRTYGRADTVLPPPVGPTVTDYISAVSGAATYVVQPVGGLTHPGVLLGIPQLDFVKGKIAASAAPWTTEYTKMLNAKCDLVNSANNTRAFSDLSWVPTPWVNVGRGSSGNPSEGDHDEQADAIAAYANALRWYYTGNRAAAQKAIQILNAWSSTLQSHKFDTTTYADGLLQSAWTGSLWPRSAEIMRYTFTATGTETAFDAVGFEDMLKRAHLPRVRYGWSGGGLNWLNTMAEATMAIAVYCDDTAEFNRACDMWRQWTVSGIYMSGDRNAWPQLSSSTPPTGGLPISPRLPAVPNITPAGWSSTTAASTAYDRSTTSAATMRGYWHNPTAWPNGIQGEMGRDPWHMTFGFASIINAAEMARVQGIDLYGEQETRLATSVELACQFLHDSYVDSINPPAGFPFASTSTWGTQPTNTQRISWAMAYNHFHNRRGYPMTETAAVITDYVSGTGYRAALHIAFEPLTHTGAP